MLKQNFCILIITVSDFLKIINSVQSSSITYISLHKWASLFSYSCCLSSSMFSCPHLCFPVLDHVAIFSSMFPCPRPCCHVLVHVSMSSSSMFPCNRPCLHVLVYVFMSLSMSMSMSKSSLMSILMFMSIFISPYC
jgi:hypothetical protein